MVVKTVHVEGMLAASIPEAASVSPTALAGT
jgi:hypothetical protein